MKRQDIPQITVRQLQHHALEYFDRVDNGEAFVIVRKSPTVRFYKIVAMPMKGIIG